MKRAVLAILACTMVVSSFAQDQFVVYSMKGEITTTQKDRQSPIQTSDILSANSTIQLSPGAAITFICNNRGIFSLTKEGSYSLKKYPDSCYKPDNIVFQNYLQFIWENAIKPGRNRRAYFPNYPGAVIR